jgi:hypothetical protein
MSTRCGNHHNILPLFGGLDESLTFSPFLTYTMKHTHIVKKQLWLRGGRGMAELLTSPPALGVLFIEKLMTKLPLWPNTKKMSELG